MDSKSFLRYALPIIFGLFVSAPAFAAPGPDLSATKSCTLGANQTVTCTITIHNGGNVPSAAPLHVTDTVSTPPAGTLYTGAGGSLPFGCSAAGPYTTPVQCNANTSLAPGATGTLLVAFKLPQGGVLYNCATVSQGQNPATLPDPNLNNNTGCTKIQVPVTVGKADLSAVKACTIDPATPQTVKCNITVLNHGTAASSSPFTLVDTMSGAPPGTTYNGPVMGGTTVSCTPGPGLYSMPITCTGNYSLNPSQSASVILSFTLPKGGSFANCAKVTQNGSPLEANMNDNTGCTKVVVPPPVSGKPDIKVTKACTPDPAHPHTVICNITVANVGTAASISPFTLVDTLGGQPPGTVFNGTVMGGTTVGCSPSSGTYSGPITCTGNYALAFGNAPGSSASVILSFTGPKGAKFKNCAKATQGSGSPVETNLANNTSCISVAFP
jgi:hypothetical protein